MKSLYELYVFSAQVRQVFGKKNSLRSLFSAYRKQGFGTKNGYPFWRTVGLLIVAIPAKTRKPITGYSFGREKDSFEMVVTDDGETWVNFWGLWKGTIQAPGESFEMPVHLTSKFVDGKIVETLGYWNSTAIAMALTELSQTRAAMEMNDNGQ